MSEPNPVLELEIYLIRHAQSVGNAGFGDPEKLTVADKADPVLSEKGVVQAEKLGEFLSDIDFACVYSSALRRAAQTASAVVRKQKTKKKHLLFPLLTENGMNDDYIGAAWEELHSINPDAVLIPELSPDAPILHYNDYKDEPSHFQRAKETVEYFRSHHADGEKLCVVSHAAFITYIVFYLMGHEKTPAFDISFANTGITKIEFYKPGTNRFGDIIFEYINDTSHLPENMRSK